MKNEHIIPHRKVPKKLRIQIYKEAILHIESESYRFRRDSERPLVELCLLLPCLLWNLSHYCSLAPNDRNWSFSKMYKMFPELTEIINKLNENGCNNENRVTYLKEALQQLKSK